MVSPLLADTSRQARAGAGFDRAAFSIDFDRRCQRRPRPVTALEPTQIYYVRTMRETQVDPVATGPTPRNVRRVTL